jgi:hypothetical protein
LKVEEMHRNWRNYQVQSESQVEVLENEVHFQLKRNQSWVFRWKKNKLNILLKWRKTDKVEYIYIYRERERERERKRERKRETEKERTKLSTFF